MNATTIACAVGVTLIVTACGGGGVEGLGAPDASIDSGPIVPFPEATLLENNAPSVHDGGTSVEAAADAADLEGGDAADARLTARDADGLDAADAGCSSLAGYNTACGRDSSGKMLCDSSGMLTCQNECPDNGCGGCTTLSNLGKMCGRENSGSYKCNGHDVTSCQGECTDNGCGGCTALPTLGKGCSACGSGKWKCNGADAVQCVGGCGSSDPCCHAQDGVYCGYSTLDGFAGQTARDGLFYCSGGCTTTVASCSAINCGINPNGADLCCVPGNGNCCVSPLGQPCTAGNGVCGQECGTLCCPTGLQYGCISNSPADCE
jgi:hypothetical protein